MITRDEAILFDFYDRAPRYQKSKVHMQFEKLREAYPTKSATEMWLTAIADIRDGKMPWLD